VTDDAALFDAWLGGDRDAGAELIERYYDAIVRFFRTKVGDSGDVAADLVQRTFLGLAESGGRFRGTSSFRAFLYGVARNIFLEHLRTLTRDRLRDPDFAVSSVVDLRTGVATRAARAEERRLLVDCLQQLPVELQVAVELHYWEDVSVGELAEIQGVPPGTVKSRLFRARGLLREALAAAEAAPAEKAAVGALLDAWPAVEPDAG
jgi:RNA polymerase sigma factor (sigma-70 family)